MERGCRDTLTVLKGLLTHEEVLGATEGGSETATACAVAGAGVFEWQLASYLRQKRATVWEGISKMILGWGKPTGETRRTHKSGEKSAHADYNPKLSSCKTSGIVLALHHGPLFGLCNPLAFFWRNRTRARMRSTPNPG